MKSGEEKPKMDNEKFGEMKESQNETDPIVEAVLEKCISIYKEIGINEEKLDENAYGRFPSVAYIEKQKTTPGKTRLSSVRETIEIWKYEEEKLCHDVRVPVPIASKMYFNRAHFVFEIIDHKLRFEYYFGPRYGRGMEFDIVETGDTVQFVNERNRWVS